MRPREQIVHETLREFKRTQQRNQPQARQLSDKIEFVRITEQVCYENRTFVPIGMPMRWRKIMSVPNDK